MTETIKPTIYNGALTITSAKTGAHRTFEIKTWKKAGKRVLSLMTGPDNVRSFTPFAFVDDKGIFVWKKMRHGTQFSTLAEMVWSLCKEGEASPWHARGFSAKMERKCLRCNKRLTNPVSIESGIGPECAGR